MTWHIWYGRGHKFFLSLTPFTYSLLLSHGFLDISTFPQPFLLDLLCVFPWYGRGNKSFLERLSLWSLSLSWSLSHACPAIVAFPQPFLLDLLGVLSWYGCGYKGFPECFSLWSLSLSWSLLLSRACSAIIVFSSSAFSTWPFLFPVQLQLFFSSLFYLTYSVCSLGMDVATRAFLNALYCDIILCIVCPAIIISSSAGTFSISNHIIFCQTQHLDLSITQTFIDCMIKEAIYRCTDLSQYSPLTQKRNPFFSLLLFFSMGIVYRCEKYCSILAWL